MRIVKNWLRHNCQSDKIRKSNSFDSLLRNKGDLKLQCATLCVLSVCQLASLHRGLRIEFRRDLVKCHLHYATPLALDTAQTAHNASSLSKMLTRIAGPLELSLSSPGANDLTKYEWMKYPKSPLVGPTSIYIYRVPVNIGIR